MTNRQTNRQKAGDTYKKKNTESKTKQNKRQNRYAQGKNTGNEAVKSPIV